MSCVDDGGAVVVKKKRQTRRRDEEGEQLDEAICLAAAAAAMMINLVAICDITHHVLLFYSCRHSLLARVAWIIKLCVAGP